MSAKNQYQEKTSDYYNDLYKNSGNDVEGVGSASILKKNIRYSKISEVFLKDNSDISIHDVGFALAHYYHFLKENFPNRNIVYSGSEVTSSFVEECEKNLPDCKFYHRDIKTDGINEEYDYITFSGTFYHRAGISDEVYYEEIKGSLESAFEKTKKGIAVNFMSDLVDFKYESLYYQNMNEVVDYARKNLSRFVHVDQSYPLYEYTLYIYKDSYIQSLYPDAELNKYFAS